MLERLKKLRIAPIIQYIWSRTSDFFKKGDMFLLVMCCICTCFGITLVGSATKSYPSHTFVPIQVFAFILGLFLYYVLTVLDVSIIASRWKLLIGFETFLLLLLIPFGVSGDTVRISDGKVYLNGKKLDESYALGNTFPRGVTDEWTVGDGEMFVLGDNRAVSQDSRDIGVVKTQSMVGRVILVAKKDAKKLVSAKKL